MKKYARIKSYQGDEIFPKEAIGKIVELVGEERMSFSGHPFYKVKFLDKELKMWNGAQLAGGGYFDEIYTTNLIILK